MVAHTGEGWVYRKSVSKWRFRFAGVIGFLIGVSFMVAIIVAIQQSTERDRDSSADLNRVIEVVRERQQRTEVVKPVEPPPPPPTQQQRAPLPQLNSLLAGVDLGIQEFQVEDIAASTRSLLGDVSRGGIFNESSVDTKPRVISRTPLTYPRRAISQGLEGYVLINLLINESGDIEAAKVLASEPEGVFETAALRGVQNWRFTPARYQGQPVKVWARQRVRFDARK